MSGDANATYSLYSEGSIHEAYVVLKIQPDMETYIIHEGRRKMMQRTAAVITYRGSNMGAW